MKKVLLLFAEKDFNLTTEEFLKTFSEIVLTLSGITIVVKLEQL